MVGTIERRLLINYRVEAEALRRILPPPFRPQLVGSVGMAGICMIRLGHLRPAGMPRAIGLTTENAAHRVAVEWDGPNGPRHGVYIPRRDTASGLTVLLGGRVFPGEHHRARFDVDEREGRYEVSFTSVDGTAHVAVTAELAADISPGSAFASLTDAISIHASCPTSTSLRVLARQWAEPDLLLHSRGYCSTPRHWSLLSVSDWVQCLPWLDWQLILRRRSRNQNNSRRRRRIRDPDQVLVASGHHSRGLEPSRQEEPQQ